MIKRAIFLTALSFVFVMSGCASMGVSQMAGKPAPDFKVRLASGEDVALSQFRGRPVVLGFGASWCTHCKGEIPALKANYDKYGDKVAVMIVVIKSEESEVRSTIRNNDIRFMVGLDPDGEVAKLYGVKPIPVTFFIDADGVVAGDYFGALTEGTLEDRIEGMLGGK